MRDGVGACMRCRSHACGGALSAAPEQVFATASIDGTVRVYDARNGKCAHVFTGHTDSILDMVVAMEESKVAAVVSAGDDMTGRLFRFDVEMH